MREANPPILRVLPILVCREEGLAEARLESFIAELKGRLAPEVRFLEPLVARGAADLRGFVIPAAEADAILIYKAHLGLGDCVLKIAEQNLPLIIFSRESTVWHALDALEHLYPRERTWVAADYQDINFRLRLLAAKKKIENTRLLILNADYPHWERWLCRISGGAEAIKARLGLELVYIPSAEVIVKLAGSKELISRASGNHHVLVHGDRRAELGG